MCEPCKSRKMLKYVNQKGRGGLFTKSRFFGSGRGQRNTSTTRPLRHHHCALTTAIPPLRPLPLRPLPLRPLHCDTPNTFACLLGAFERPKEFQTKRILLVHIIPHVSNGGNGEKLRLGQGKIFSDSRDLYLVCLYLISD